MIYVIGSINVDLILFSENFPEVGETVTGKEFFINQGGKGANQAVAAAKAGGDVIFIGRVGNDFFGDFVMNEIRKFGVKTYVTTDHSITTGAALINVDSTGQNRITIIPGANGKVGNAEIDYLKENLKVSDFLLIQGEIPTETLIKASKIANEVNASVIFDPAPVKEELAEVIPFTTYITPNEIELKKLTKTNSIEELLTMGAKNVILKLGSKGINFRNSKEEILLPAFVVEAIDTTGAGDTFNGSFAAVLSKGYSLTDALRFAVAASAISVTRKGAAVSSPTIEEIEKFLEETNKKNNN